MTSTRVSISMAVLVCGLFEASPASAQSAADSLDVYRTAVTSWVRGGQLTHPSGRVEVICLRAVEARVPCWRS